MLLALAVVLSLVVLHGTENQTIWLNPAAVSTLREPLGSDLRHFAPGTHCIVVLTSGKFVPVRETCAEVRDLLIERP